ncbi:hypothetical protein TRFO_17610 [Tritrichomonas foetus]|uniref:Ras-GAP domain-containing protein n=1 Tax=Tritrichomonas foetus TaxID=1144522 RepID=A0A1J4KMD4_9EUKA|nr:hypothetical protein TRFO_17610 [Tritrichomonas foetus]|eukprot:OHT12471.1 hypothetical protein TRFO_17610 [Tritrichomonas foetus]
MSESRMCWLIYCRDSSLIINNPGSTSQKFSKGQFSLIGDSICTNNGFTTLKYSFFSVDEFSLFHTADFSEDPLDTFIQSFKFAQSYVNEIPKIIISQIYKIMGESDFALARALFSIPKVNLTKEVALSIFKILWESGSFTTFMRFIFHQEIQALPDATTIFRGTNPATFSASTLSSLFSEAYCNMIISKISKKPDSLLNAVNSIINSCKNLPITLQFLYSTVFRVTRRRFPHNLTPVVAVSSIFMLRMILPRISTSEVSPIGKKLMNAFAFHDKASSLKEHPIYTKIFKFVVNLTKMKPSSINFPAHNLSALVDFISQEEEKIMEIYKSFNFTNNEDVNPLTPTMIEIIENCFIGSDEDLETLMNVYKIFP